MKRIFPTQIKTKLSKYYFYLIKGYAMHKDNTIDTGDESSLNGPKGQRICDRVITGLIYFSDFSDCLDTVDNSIGEHDYCCCGGTLTIIDLNGKEIEVQPKMGQLVLFQSRFIDHKVNPVLSGRRWALSAWFTYPSEMWV